MMNKQSLEVELPLAQAAVLARRDQVIQVEPRAARQRIERMGVLDLNDLVDAGGRVHNAVGVNAGRG